MAALADPAEDDLRRPSRSVRPNAPGQEDVVDASSRVPVTAAIRVDQSDGRAGQLDREHVGCVGRVLVGGGGDGGQLDSKPLCPLSPVRGRDGDVSRAS